MPTFQKNPVLFIAAVLVSLGLCGSTISWILAGRWCRNVKPPIITHNNQRIFLATNHEIVVLDRTGNHQFSVPTEELGIGRARAIHALAKDKVLISDGNHVLACDLPNRTCRTIVKNATQSRRAGTVSLQQQGDITYVAESTKPQINAYTNGKLTGTLNGATEKRRPPTQILFDKNGNLVVINAFTRQLTAFHTDITALGKTAWSFSTQTDLLDENRWVPMQIAAGRDETWWVLLQTSDQPYSSFREGLWQNLFFNKKPKVGALAIFNTQGQAIKRVSLPAGIKPTHFIPMSQAMLAVDFDRHRFIPVAYDGAVLDQFQAPDLYQQLDVFQQEINRFQRLYRASFAAMILTIFHLSILMILANNRQNKHQKDQPPHPQEPSGPKVYRYPQNPNDPWLALLVIVTLLAFWGITLWWTVEAEESLQFVITLNLIITLCTIMLGFSIWLPGKRRNAVRVSQTNKSISYQDHRGQVEIDFTTIQNITFRRFFIPGWTTIVSPSKTISFSTAFEQGATFLPELKTALEQNNLAGKYDEAQLQTLCQQPTPAKQGRNRLSPLYAWSVAINSLFALTGFTFIPSNGILILWCIGALTLAMFVAAIIDIWHGQKRTKQSNREDPPPKDHATFQQNLKWLWIINTVIYTGALTTMMVI